MSSAELSSNPFVSWQSLIKYQLVQIKKQPSRVIGTFFSVKKWLISSCHLENSHHAPAIPGWERTRRKTWANPSWLAGSASEQREGVQELRRLWPRHPRVAPREQYGLPAVPEHPSRNTMVLCQGWLVRQPLYMCHVGFILFRFLNQRVLLQQVEGLREVQEFYITFIPFITQSCNLLGER